MTVSYDFGKANPGQKEAIKHDKGPLLITAGPGTGKTFTLIQRLVYLVKERGVAPEKIMVCTFTEKAAKELVTRVTNEFDRYGIRADLNAMYIGTIHSLCLRILKENVEYLQDYNKNFRMLDELLQRYMVHSHLKFFYDRFGDKENFDKKIRPFEPARKKDQPVSPFRRSTRICELVNKFSEDLVDPDKMIRDAQTPGFLDPYRKNYDIYDDQAFLDNMIFVAELLKAYKELSVQEGFFDFSSIQTTCYQLLQNEKVLDRIHEKIEYVMVDEYQDTNFVQEQLMFLIAGDRKNICVVGDDDQALYRFRGATVRNILEFKPKMEESGAECKECVLDINYRSDPAIIDTYNEWMAYPGDFSWSNGEKRYRLPKTIKPDEERKAAPGAVLKISGAGCAQRICDLIKNLKSMGKITDYNQVVLLASSVKTDGYSSINERNSALVNCFQANGIPIFSPRSGEFFNREEVKLAIGILKKLCYVYEEDCIAANKQNTAGAIKQILHRSEGATGDRDLEFANEKLEEYAELKAWVEGMVASFKANRDDSGYADFTYTELLYHMYAFEPFRKLMSTDSTGTAYDTRAVRNLAILTQIAGSYEESRGISIINPNRLDHAQSFFYHYLMQIKDSGRLEEYEGDVDYAPSGCVSYMTIHQSKGLEFPVVIQLLDTFLIKKEKDHEKRVRVIENICHQPSYEPVSLIADFDFYRKSYVAFSRAQDMLVLVDDGAETSYRRILQNIKEYTIKTDLSALSFEPIKHANIKPTLSFTSHIAKYDECPREYMFLKEFEFSPVKAGSYLFGTLVHQTIEDVHRAALRGDERLITGDNIERWFHANYAALIKQQHAHGMTPQIKQAAIDQVKRYVARRGGDWSQIRETEVDVSLAQEQYIMGGTIDLIQGSGDTVELVDFKSEANPRFLPENSAKERERKVRELERMERYQKQLKVYAHLVEQRTGHKVSAMNIYYTGEPGADYIISIPYKQEDVDASIQEFDTTAKKILNKEYEIEGGCDKKVCGECSFRFYCGKVEENIER